MTATGYRKMWYGTFATKADTYTSSDFRDSALFNQAVTTGEITIPIPINAYRVVIALPTGYTLDKVLDVNDSSSNIVSSFKTGMELAIEGANKFAALAYNLYYLDYANPNNAVNTYKATIKKEGGV